jgi:hypothetical protein
MVAQRREGDGNEMMAKRNATTTARAESKQNP